MYPKKLLIPIWELSKTKRCYCYGSLSDPLYSNFYGLFAAMYNIFENTRVKVYHLTPVTPKGILFGPTSFKLTSWMRKSENFYFCIFWHKWLMNCIKRRGRPQHIFFLNLIWHKTTSNCVFDSIADDFFAQKITPNGIAYSA